MLLEPEPSNAFENLDRHIMRDTFRAFETQDPKRQRIRIPEEYATMNEYWVDKVLGPGAGKSVAGFLDEPPQQAGPSVFANSGVDLTKADLAQQIAGMVGRALVLLRFATGAARNLLTDSGCTIDQVDFWLEDMLTLHGIRLPTSVPRNYFDLYDGISEMVVEIGALDTETSPLEMAMITELLPEEFQTLSGFERVPAWAVA
jgi:hypothetical protein